MGLFDDLSSQLRGAMGAGATEHADVLSHMMQSLGPGGGLGGLLQSFQSQGLGHLVQSWIGTGQNLPVTAAQIQAALGNSHVRELAAKLGIDPTQAAAKLAAVLPHLVDQLTPGGQLPAGVQLPQS